MGVIALVSVSLLFSIEYPILRPDEPALRARRVMRDTGLRIIPVVESSILKGIISRLGVLSITSARSNLRIADIAEEPLVILRQEEELSEAVDKMLSVDEWYAPVVDEANRYKGVLGLEHIISYYLRREDKPSNLIKPVEEFMTSDVEVVYADDNILSLWKKMLKYRYAGYPVLDNKGRLVGVVTQYDLIKHGFTRIDLESESPPRKGPRIREIMSTPPIVVKPSDPLVKAAEIMLNKGIGRVLVVNLHNELLGIVDREDIVKAIMGKS